MRLVSRFSQQIGRPEGSGLCWIPTHFDERIARVASDYLRHKAESVTGVFGHPDSPSRIDLAIMKEEDKILLIELIKERNRFFEYCSFPWMQCQIFQQEVDYFFNKN